MKSVVNPTRYDLSMYAYYQLPLTRHQIMEFVQQPVRLRCWLIPQLVFPHVIKE